MIYNSQKIFPTIELEDFILREKQDGDVEDFFSYYSDLQVNKFILAEIPQTVEEARRELHYWRAIFYQNDGIYFAIADKKDNRLIGSIGLSSHNNYHRRIELSYDLASQYWRRGITSRAIKEVVKYGFDNLHVVRIEAFCSIENEASKNLLLKCGFTLEGILRKHRYHKGSYVDVYIFSLLAEEFYGLNP